MTSKINPNNIDVNYPIPGVNNSTQGMRDNFAAIKNIANTAYNELTDLQSKVIVKSSLLNDSTSTANINDMANTVISNALTRGFRASTYNLGTSLSGNVLINVNQGDVQYGNIVANTTISFCNWAPPSTVSNVALQFNISNANAVISFENKVTSSQYSMIENSIESGGVMSVVPYANNVQLNYNFSSIDCGNTVMIMPINRSFVATQTQIPTTVPATSNVTLTGTITSLTTSTAVVGIGTLFSTELFAGQTLLNSSNANIGVIQSITDDFNLTLTLNSLIAVTSSTYKVKDSAIGDITDRAGMMKTSGNYLYVCTGNYDGITVIWKRVLLSSY